MIVLGSSKIVSGGSFSSREITSPSLRCVRPSYGLASYESKLGSPEPGTSIEQKPVEWPMPSVSSNGQKRADSPTHRGSMCVMYGPLARAARQSLKTCTEAPCTAASMPVSEMSIDVAMRGVWYS